MKRTVWDGDQALYEIRSSGKTGVSSSYMDGEGSVAPGDDENLFGRVAYAHAQGIDQPVGVLKRYGSTWGYVTPHANWKGDWTYGTFSDGSLCLTVGAACPYWPGFYLHTHAGETGSQPPSYAVWWGSLTRNRADGSGLQYLRNRYYDPKTGRFTQQDPIGLAGGLNLYVFAGGDPVNLSDPFGLCEPFPECASGALASPGLFDPVLLLAGGVAGGIRSLFTRVFVRAAAADATATAGIPSATNPALQRTISALFRPGDRIAGGTAGAIRHEAGTRTAVGGRFHLQKGIERIRNLENILAREELSAADRAVAERLLSDLRSAVEFAQEMARRAAK